MKKSIITLLLLLIICSCSFEPRMSQLRFKNITSQELVVAFENGGEKHFINLNSFELIGTEYFMEETTGIEVQTEDGRTDYAYRTEGVGTVSIYNNPAISYTVKCLIPSDAFKGEEVLSLEYQKRFEGGSIVLGTGLIMNIESYDKPHLSASTCNGYPISLRIEGNQIIIY